LTQSNPPGRALSAGTPVTVTIHGTLVSHLLPGDAVSLASSSPNSAEPGPLYIRPGYVLNVEPDEALPPAREHLVVTPLNPDTGLRLGAVDLLGIGIVRDEHGTLRTSMKVRDRDTGLEHFIPGGEIEIREAGA
jgi:antitoxin (DNA-binding transcriptional repressor) of toxin-antitoxin stability system